MKSITVHGLDNELYALLRLQATSQGLSLNKTIKQILRASLGLKHKRAKKRDFSKFVGVWSKKEADAIDKVLEDFEKIDEEDWK
jgi:plasmid stability protein